MTEQLRQKFFAAQVPFAFGESAELRRKPWPDMPLAALRKLGSAAETSVYVGDSEVDVQTAKNAGIPCLSVGWGFRSAQELHDAGVSEIFNTPQELLNELLSRASD